MRDAKVLTDGSRIRWVELPGSQPARVFLHGLGASSPPYYAQAAAHPALLGRRTLLMDFLGFGISDRPADFAYTLEDHADAVAAALAEAGVTGAEVVAHSMGGAIAVVLAARHPRLVSKLVLVDANLDPIEPPPVPTTQTEAEFRATGWPALLERIGPHWAATMRLATPEAVHRSLTHLARATVPTMREHLVELPIARTFVHPAGDPPPNLQQLAVSGVRLVAIPDAGHNIMLDNVDAFAEAVASA
jgi:pimeloyl-ACP methyl ester carboxylesterase